MAWSALGPEALSIEVLDELDRTDDSGDVAEDLIALKQVWLESLQAKGTPLYPMSLRGA